MGFYSSVSSPAGSHSEDGTTQTGSGLHHAASRLDGAQRLLRVERLGFDPFARCPISCASTTLGGMNGNKATRPEKHPDEAAAEDGIAIVPPAPERNTINLSKRETPNQPRKLWVSRAARQIHPTAELRLANYSLTLCSTHTATSDRSAQQTGCPACMHLRPKTL